MAVERDRPELIRDEDPWQSLHGWRGHAHVRVWRSAPDLVIAVISGAGAEYRLDELIPKLCAEYPHDGVELFFHRPMDWMDLGYYAALTMGDDGTVIQTRLFGDTLAARLGPTFYATEDPDDESVGYGGP